MTLPLLTGMARLPWRVCLFVELALQIRTMTPNPMPLPSDVLPRSRTDARTALVVDLALAILESAGTAPAAQYLHDSGVAIHVALRVLNPLNSRRKSEH